MGNSTEGVRIACEAAESAIAGLKKQLEALGNSSENIKFTFDPKSERHLLSVLCPYRVRLLVSYRNNVTNSLCDALFYFILAHSKDMWIDDSSNRDVVKRHTLKPNFDHTLKLVWSENDLSLTTEQLTAFVLDALVMEISKHHAEAEAKKQL